MRKTLFSLILSASLACLPAQSGRAESGAAVSGNSSSAVILVYHRVGEDAYPDSNIRTEQFLTHIQEITDGDYNVLPLSDIIDAAKNHKPLPPRTLAITFDGAKKSIFENAVPALLDKKIPFTLFYASDQVDSGTAQTMTWGNLKDLSRREGVSLGLMPASYLRLPDVSDVEARRQVNKALQRHREMIGTGAQFFAYPFGEYSRSAKKIVDESGFSAAFGLQSGTVYAGSDFLALPRFTMTEKYGDLERFRLVANALPFPAFDIEPQDSRLTGPTPSIGFSVPEDMKNEIKDLSCFLSDQTQPKIEILGNRVELRLPEAPGDERLRINCTLPSPINTDEDIVQWRWFGMLLSGPGNAAADIKNQQPDVLP